MKNKLIIFRLLLVLLTESMPASNSIAIPTPRRSPNCIVTTIRGASLISPLQSISNKNYLLDSDDELYTMTTSSPRRIRSDSLFYAIENGNFDDAQDIVNDLVGDGKFSPSVAAVAGDKLLFVVKSPRKASFVSIEDSKKAIQDLQAVINGGKRASSIVAFALKSGSLTEQKFIAIQEKIDRIMDEYK
jgi:hypothetical protein